MRLHPIDRLNNVEVRGMSHKDRTIIERVEALELFAHPVEIYDARILTEKVAKLEKSVQDLQDILVGHVNAQAPRVVRVHTLTDKE